MAKSKKEISVTERLKKISTIFKSSQSSIDKLNGSVVLSGEPTTKGSQKNKKLIDLYDDIVDNKISTYGYEHGGDLSQFIIDMSKRTGKDFISRQNAADGVSTILETYRRTKIAKLMDIDALVYQLPALREAVMLSRDSICEADKATGSISRDLIFSNRGENQTTDLISTVEMIEQKYDLLRKIKDYIVLRTLEWGEYYAYIVPYSKIISDFEVIYGDASPYRTSNKANPFGYNLSRPSPNKTRSNTPNESRILTESIRNSNNDVLLESAGYRIYNDPVKLESFNELKKTHSKFLSDFDKNFLETIASNIIIGEKSTLSIPVIECPSEHVRTVWNKYKDTIKSHNENSKEYSESCKEFLSQVGIFNEDMIGMAEIDRRSAEVSKKYSFIDDCYLRLIKPSNLVPIKVLDQVIGYYYIKDLEIYDIARSRSVRTIDYDRFKTNSTLVTQLVDSIVDSFSPGFVRKYSEFRDVIVAALQQYDMTKNRMYIQFIPVDYIVPFKVDEDEEGNGTSILENSIFYAKLYLLMLLFKITTILSQGNDTKVHYVKSSGIDDNIFNDINQAIRRSQATTVTASDLFALSAGNIIDRVGRGNQQFIMVGTSDIRPIETDILPGQDVPLDTPLMEMCFDNAISATGEPSVLVNMIKEPEFAKQLEISNTRSQSRRGARRITLNNSITQMYRKIFKYSTNFSNDIINSFNFSLNIPSTTNLTTDSETLRNFNDIKEVIMATFMSDKDTKDENGNPTEFVNIFAKKLADFYLPQLDIPKIDELFEESKIEFTKKQLLDKYRKDKKAKDIEESMGDEDVENVNPNDFEDM